MEKGFGGGGEGGGGGGGERLKGRHTELQSFIGKTDDSFDLLDVLWLESAKH